MLNHISYCSQEDYHRHISDIMPNEKNKVTDLRNLVSAFPRFFLVKMEDVNFEKILENSFTILRSFIILFFSFGIMILEADSSVIAYHENSKIQPAKGSSVSTSQSKLQEIRQYIKKLWPHDKINSQDIIDTFDLCIKEMKVIGWNVDSYDPKRISVFFDQPFAGHFFYKTTPIRFYIKERVDVNFTEDGNAKIMTFSNDAMKGTKIINVYLNQVEFNNLKNKPKDQKTVTLELGMFFGTKSVEWKLDKLQSVLSTITVFRTTHTVQSRNR